MKSILLSLATAAVLLTSVTVYAHHSRAAFYQQSKTVKIEGKLVQFMFRNPHSFIQVMAPDEKGEMRRWGVEWGGAGQLGGQGLTKETLRAGDNIIVIGHPSRTPGEYMLQMQSLRRTSDGFEWGTRPGEVVD